MDIKNDIYFVKRSILFCDFGICTYFLFPKNLTFNIINFECFVRYLSFFEIKRIAFYIKGDLIFSFFSAVN